MRLLWHRLEYTVHTQAHGTSLWDLLQRSFLSVERSKYQFCFILRKIQTVQVNRIESCRLMHLDARYYSS